MKLIVHNYYDANIYTIYVPDYIRISTLANIIKDKENISETLFERIKLSSWYPFVRDQPLPPITWSYPPLHSPDYKLSEIPELINNPHIWTFLRLLPG